MPGNQVKDWHIYHECMKDKAATPENKGYCARVANAAANKQKESLQQARELVRIGAEQGVKEAHK